MMGKEKEEGSTSGGLDSSYKVERHHIFELAKNAQLWTFGAKETSAYAMIMISL